MKNYNLLSIIILTVVMTSCWNTKKNSENIFSIDNSKLKQQYSDLDQLSISIKNSENKKIDSISYSINNIFIETKKDFTPFTFDLKNQKLGYKTIKSVVYYDGNKSEDSTRIELLSGLVPKLLNYKIINTYPHDITSYTQGLEFYRDTLYEGTGNGQGNGTGNRGISSLIKTDYKTGKAYKKLVLDMKIFGEGITILDNKVYQLTYQNNEGYIYNADNFNKEKTIPYYKTMEGWGLTNDGKNLYMTDSSERISILDPNTFKEVDHVNVYTNGSKIKEVNELEWVDGKIYGNIYQKNAIAIINPKNGAVEAVINLADLEKQITKLPDTDVLNGIAYNPKTKTFFVTGKNWNKMFEIKIEN